MIELHAYCEVGNHYPDEVIAGVPDEFDPDGLGVIVYGTGESSNRWADGIVGVPADVQELAECDESPMCPEHYAEIASWQR